MAGIATKSLKGKVALVTGGSGGIGASIVRRLAADGASVPQWSVAFTYSSSPDRFRKLCLLVPMERFEGVLPDSELLWELISRQAQICLNYWVPVSALLPITCSQAMKNPAMPPWKSR
jgi:hypothetical protein